MKIFIDRTAFYALSNKAEASHKQAMEYHTGLLSAKDELITSSQVMNDSFNYAAEKLGREAAEQFGNFIHETKAVKTVRIDQPLEEQAWKIFYRDPDRSKPFVDYTSLALLRMLKIQRVFTFNAYFRELGFEIVPESGKIVPKGRTK